MDRRITVLALASFALGTEAYVYAGHLAELADDLGVPLAQAGQVATVFALTYALSAPLVAGLVSGLGRRRVLVWGLLLLGALNLLAALAPSLGALMAVRFACGLAAGLVGPIATIAAAELARPEERGRAMALVLSGLTLAFVLGIPMGSVVGDWAGWRGTFVYAGALALAAALAIRLVLPDMPGGRRPGADAVRAALQPAVLRNLALTALGFAATFSAVAYIGPLVTAITGLTGSGIGAMQAMVGVGSLIGIALGARAADRAEAAGPFLVATFLASGASLAAYSLLMAGGGADAAEPLLSWPRGGIALGLAAAIVLGAATLFARTPVIQARLVATAPPDARPVVLALNGSMVFLGQGIGAGIGGAVIAGAGLPWLGVAAAGLSVAGAGLALRQARRLVEVQA